MLCVSVHVTVKFIRPADVLPAQHLEEKEVFPMRSQQRRYRGHYEKITI